MSASGPRRPVLRSLRSSLDALYRLCGAAAAAFLVLLLALIVAQMAARWTGRTFPGATSYAGYCMAASAFFALAYALDHGAHIRVNLLLSRLGGARRWGERWCFGIGSAVAAYFAWYAIKTTYWSWKLNDVSQGQDAWPLWIPQVPMAIGTTVFAVALVDHLLRVLLGGLPEGGPPAPGRPAGEVCEPPGGGPATLQRRTMAGPAAGARPASRPGAPPAAIRGTPPDKPAGRARA